MSKVVDITCIGVDFNDERQMEQLVRMLNAYSMDPMGGGNPLTEEVKQRLKEDLRNVNGACSWLAYLGENREEPVGLINCFKGYSTFRASPLLNIHDIVVLPEHRGKNIGATLIETVVGHARREGYCKITLEVRSDNPAERLYRRLGFTDGNHPMSFLTKEL